MKRASRKGDIQANRHDQSRQRETTQRRVEARSKQTTRNARRQASEQGEDKPPSNTKTLGNKNTVCHSCYYYDVRLFLWNDDDIGKRDGGNR